MASWEVGLGAPPGLALETMALSGTRLRRTNFGGESVSRRYNMLDGPGCRDRRIRRLDAQDGVLTLRWMACEFENREGRKFCASCGAALPAACRECGYANQDGEKY